MKTYAPSAIVPVKLKIIFFFHYPLSWILWNRIIRWLNL
ncbi:hypothetical protein NC651_039523 [Populus alba x Populus x berolinensis]|nr:hypothetical protein NC651_039523 [Populus alba x Populus x berolinensis]